MSSQKINDERVLAQKRKIQSDAFAILFFGLLLSVLIQQIMFNAPVSQYIVEFIFFISASIYLLVRNIMYGNDIFSPNKPGHRSVIINSLVCGLTITVIHTTLNYMRLGSLFTTDFTNTLLVTLITFLCSTIIAFVAFELLYIVSEKKKQQIETKFKDDDE
ncbi:putative copper export protein [Anaerotaenia torta]|uniref:DUF6773 family protein n=1 Tax=Anaerotaenia torta TaxID=433293 RepID=UPI003D233CE4